MNPEMKVSPYKILKNKTIVAFNSLKYRNQEILSQYCTGVPTSFSLFSMHYEK